MSASDFWFWDMDKERITFDQGEYVFEFGASSRDIRGSVSATLKGIFQPELKTVVADCGRVVMHIGEEARCLVTAAMTDDSFFDIQKADIAYTSNHPEVASIDARGLVRAHGAGVATFTAHVTINGKTVTGSFPVKVMPDLQLASILVDNKPIPGFSPAIKQYSYLFKSSSSGSPRVEATASHPLVLPEIIQASAVPGTAALVLKDRASNDQQQYLVSFGLRSAGDEFNGSTPDKNWQWIRENPDRWSLLKKPGMLVIESAKGDLAGSSNDAENLILQSANTDWVVESKIICSRKPSGFSQYAGILARQDDDQFVRLVYRAQMGRPTASGEQPGALELMVEENGFQKAILTLSTEGIVKDDNELILRLEKKGSLYTGYCSADGKTFQTVGNVDVLLRDIHVGLIVCEGVLPARMAAFMRTPLPAQGPETPFEVAFDYFRITNTGVL